MLNTPSFQKNKVLRPPVELTPAKQPFAKMQNAHQKGGRFNNLKIGISA
jgi:hypothetical protein